jgi:hypothetical protein
MNKQFNWNFDTDALRSVSKYNLTSKEANELGEWMKDKYFAYFSEDVEGCIREMVECDHEFSDPVINKTYKVVN